MERRDVLKAGLCYFGGICLTQERSWAGAGHTTRLPRVPANLDLRARSFEVELRRLCRGVYLSRLQWLESMLHRLGKNTTLALWTEAFRVPDDGLMESLLSEGWSPAANEEEVDPIEAEIEARFASPVQGVSRDEAHVLVMMDTAASLPMELHSSLAVRRQLTAYEALHLRLDGIGRLAATMANHLGKEGELVAYDIIRESRLAKAALRSTRPSEVDVLREWSALARTSEPSMFTAGLDVKLVKESDTEVIIHVQACEWARYFSERHPTVAYLVSCSTDDAELRATNKNLRMQRTTTLMEGGSVCDFRVYIA